MATTARYPLTRLACCVLGLSVSLPVSLRAATPAPQSVPVETVLYSFANDAIGYWPYGVAWNKGRLFGTSYDGGYYNQGTLYELSVAGKIKLLHSFGGHLDGANSTSNLTIDKMGNIFGTTIYGGTYGLGSIFKSDLAGNTTVLYSFPGGSGGEEPEFGNLIINQGTLYGVSTGGSVFKVSSAGVESLLWTFYYQNKPGDSSYPEGALALYQGRLYGTSSYGGPANVGTIFSLGVGSQHEKLLYSFTGGADGSYPTGGVIPGDNGLLYGMAVLGGSSGVGSLFSIDKTGKFTLIHSFTATGADGGYPQFGMIKDAAGNIYGTTEGGGLGGAGTVFEFVPATGAITTLYSFAAGSVAATDGQTPDAQLTIDPDGNLYGTTQGGGASGYGTVFKIALSSTPTPMVATSK
jgi:uncharacterized repeat protein (TIGR03803 family)